MKSLFVGAPVSRLAAACATAFLTLGLLTTSACDSGPKPGEEAAYWGEKLKAEDKKTREKAMKELTRLKDPKSLPALYEALRGEDPSLRSDAAQLVGFIGDEGSTPALVDGIDFRAGAGRDKKGRIAATANERIAKALGAVGKENDPKAVAALKRLASSPHQNTQLGAIWALGELRATDAVQDLIDIADGHENNYMVKNAVIALGHIADEKAVPVLIKLLFFERGVSFYREASYALFQIGKPAVEPMIQVYKNEYKPIAAMHVDAGVQKAKAIEVLGDIGDARFIPFVIESSGVSVGDTASALTRAKADFVAGRLGVKGAVPVLVKHWDDVDVSKSEFALASLAQIGAKEVAPALLKMTTHDGYMNQCVKVQQNKETQCRFSEAQVRKPRLLALSQLSDGSDLDAWNQMIAQSDALKAAEEKGANSDDALLKKVAKAATKGHEKTKKLLEERKPMLEAAKDCGDKKDCWISKLASENPRVRERAGYALMHLGGEESLNALAKNLGDPDNEARYAAILAVWRAMPQGELGQTLLKRIDEILKEERGKTQFVRINEDLKRLRVKLARGY